jgi:hypothetical protein
MDSWPAPSPRHEWQWPRAEEHCLRALELAPTAAEVHHEYAMPQGRFEEALARNRRARELDPFSATFIHACIGSFRPGGFEQAEQEYRLLVADGQDPLYFGNHVAIVWQARGVSQRPPPSSRLRLRVRPTRNSRRRLQPWERSWANARTPNNCCSTF